MMASICINGVAIPLYSSSELLFQLLTLCPSTPSVMALGICVLYLLPDLFVSRYSCTADSDDQPWYADAILAQ